jgi:hypothetical protein
MLLFHNSIDLALVLETFILILFAVALVDVKSFLIHPLFQLASPDHLYILQH